MAGRDVDPLIGFQFALEAGDVEGYFTEIGGIGSENAVVTHKVVTKDAKEVTLQIPGRVEWGEITLKRGLTKDLQLWKWREQVVTGGITDARKDVTVTMFDRSYELATTWTMINAWPSKISGPQIASDSNDFTVEELTLVHEGLRREDMDTMIPAFEGPAGG
jgi:phage tail-like protein